MTVNKIILRDARPCDAEQICGIMRNRLVAAQQYRQSDLDKMQRLLEKLFGSEFSVQNFPIRYSVIDSDSNVPGYVIHTHETVRSGKQVSCGWNLLPEYWGKGVMASSLSVLFDQFFAVGVENIRADYFNGNERCKQMLIRLGFQPSEIGVIERIRLSFSQCCLRWILRMELSPTKWVKVKENRPPTLKVESRCRNFLDLYGEFEVKRQS